MNAMHGEEHGRLPRRFRVSQPARVSAASQRGGMP